MCGFFGVFDKNGGIRKSELSIIKAGKRLSHRGPDDEGEYFDDFWGVYFCRLSIIDTSLSGHQPMFSENKNLVIVFNGEIYNYIELKNELIKKGHIFMTNSDTEVLLKCFQEYGSACAGYLRGMYAFAIWDVSAKKLFVCRDRLGIKPLYICKKDGVILLSSEIKSILGYVRMHDHVDINERTLFKFLAKGWLDDSLETFYKDIDVFPAASYSWITQNGVSEKKYWFLQFKGDRIFDPDEFNAIFFQAINIHLRSDVPVAAALSGGIDSSSIVSVASRLTNASCLIQAFSVIPPETFDESRWINKTVEYTRVWHTYLDLAFDNIPGIVDDVIVSHDEPFASSNCIFQYLLRKRIAQEKIKVLLVGEGGDEVFGGYRRFMYPYLYSLERDGKRKEYYDALQGAVEFLGIPQDSIKRNLKDYRDMVSSGAVGQENKTAYDILSSDFVHMHKDVAGMSHYPSEIEGFGNHFFAHLNQHLFVRDLPYVLRIEDRNSMAFGIETRVPLLDHVLLELTFSYLYSEFMKDGVNKAILRRAMTNYLPAEVVNRKTKSPRPGNDAHFIYKLLKAQMLDSLHSADMDKWGYWKNGLVDLFENDCRIINNERAIVWFRMYITARWLNGIKA